LQTSSKEKQLGLEPFKQQSNYFSLIKPSEEETMENQVRYKDFTPNKSEQQVCASILNLINELAPSDSFVQAKVKQDADGTYKASILINASCGDFKSECSDNSLLSSFKKAQHDILNDVKEWKTHRFLNS